MLQLSDKAPKINPIPKRALALKCVLDPGTIQVGGSSPHSAPWVSP